MAGCLLRRPGPTNQSRNPSGGGKLHTSTVGKPLTIWQAHPSFWDNRKFVCWQLLRRNQTYRKAIDYYRSLSSDSPPILMAKISFPPETKKVTFQNWWFWFGVEPGQSPMFSRPLTLEEEKEHCMGKAMYHAPRRPSPSLPSTEDLLRLGFKPVKSQVAAIRRRSLWNALYRSEFSLVDYDVDFPAPFFLPIFNQKPPPEKDRKAYSDYLYDKKFEPFDTGKGRPRSNIKKALQVWDMSRNQNMKDSKIARRLFGLEYTYGEKSPDLTRIRDLKKSADKAIQSIYK